MSLTDPIAEALTRIRNANQAKKESAEVRASKLIGQVLEILKRERFIKDFRFIDDKKQGSYKVYLKFRKNKLPVITGLKRVSLPGLRRYVKKEDVKKVYGGLGMSILTTSKGILTDDDARNQGVGGEVLCDVW
ncbi:MAG: 30S ribosomal protein S8 [Candidatus Omnitrophica bacterium]|nr:30S ribosomal protein S8 [Candidatus Omnitrophota bacterium]